MKRDKKRPVEPMDERQLRIEQRAIVYGFYFLYVWSIIVAAYRLLTTGDINLEMFGPVGATFVIILSRCRMGIADQPRDHKNRPLPTGSSKREKRVRYKSYARDSVYGALIFVVIDIVSFAVGEDKFVYYRIVQHILPSTGRGVILAISGVIAFAVGFVVWYTVLYVIGELIRVRRYNRLMETLDNAELDRE